MLLDDVLSALDSNTERRVVERLCSPEGLFRKLGTTVVLVTHSCKSSMALFKFESDIYEAQHFHIADQIVVLGSDGAIAEKGTYDMLRSQEGYIASLLKTQHTDKDTNGTIIPEYTRKAARSPA